MSKIALVFCILILGSANGQDTSLTSVLDKLLKQKPDSVKVNRLNEFAQDNRESNNILALKACEKALQISDSIHYPLGQSVATSHIGWIFYRRAEYTKALDFTTQSLKIARQLNNKVQLSSGLNNLGAIYVEQKEFNKALVTFREALSSARLTNYDYGIERSLNNMAYTSLQMNRLDSAKHFLAQVLNLPKVTTAGFANRLLGDVNVREKNFPAAEKVFINARKLAAMEGNISLQVSILHRLGRLYADMNQPMKALEVLRENEQVCKQHAMRSELASTYQALAHAYQHSKNYQKATEYFSQYIALKDSIFNESTTRRLAQQEEQYREELNQARVNLLQKEAELKEDRIQNANIKFYAAAGGVALLLLFGFFTWRNNQRLRSVNQLLEQHNIVMEEKEKELNLLNSTKDKIFSIISHDLRSPLSNMKGILSLLNAGAMTQQEFVQYSQDLKIQFDALHDNMDNLLQWARTQMKGMKVNPQVVNVAATVNFIKDALAYSAQEKQIVVRSFMDNQLNVSVDEDHLKVILRNLIVNAIKFSSPGGEVSIMAKKDTQAVEISISDTGVGISAEKVNKLFNITTHFTSKGTKEESGFGLGLLLVNEFIKKNGGSINVMSELGKGTTFKMVLPQA